MARIARKISEIRKQSYKSRDHKKSSGVMSHFSMFCD